MNLFFLLFEKIGLVGRWETKHFMGTVKSMVSGPNTNYVVVNADTGLIPLLNVLATKYILL